eukprot:scaffold3380_cov44-Phaeocystis_antarctica.AAC.5
MATTYCGYDSTHLGPALPTATVATGLARHRRLSLVEGHGEPVALLPAAALVELESKLRRARPRVPLLVALQLHLLTLLRTATPPALLLLLVLGAPLVRVAALEGDRRRRLGRGAAQGRTPGVAREQALQLLEQGQQHGQQLEGEVEAEE